MSMFYLFFGIEGLKLKLSYKLYPDSDTLDALSFNFPAVVLNQENAH